jgi:hypothetical protein
MQGSGTPLPDDYSRELKAQDVWCSFRTDEEVSRDYPFRLKYTYEGINARGSRYNLNSTPRHLQE